MASSESGKTDLLPLEGATSGVWKYFGFPSKDGKCVEPDKKKRASVRKSFGNTTNLRYHLEHSHRADYYALRLAQAPNKEAA